MLFLAPYILVPLVFALIWKYLKIPTKHTWITYLLTTTVIIFYPYIWFQIDIYLHPPDPNQVHCGNPFLGVIFANYFIFLPISIGLQMLFNQLLKIKYKGKES
jgi:hypothetical protein